MTNIDGLFNEARIGTKLLDEEREPLYAEIQDYESKMKDVEWIEAEVAANIELMGYWDVELVLMCLEHDLHFMKLTLESGIVQMN